MEIIMNQDEIFRNGEGNQWFRRNKGALTASGRFDWPIEIVESLKDTSWMTRVLELGCADGWRLARLRGILGRDVDLFGVDASEEAVREGQTRYPFLKLFVGMLSHIPLDQAFDLVIVHFVLHWVSRETLTKTVSEMDRMVKDGGMLLIGDFLPDFPQKRRYHHLPEEKRVFTFKQDNAEIFKSMGIYKEVMRFTFNHDKPVDGLEVNSSDERACCALLHKSLYDYYVTT